MKNRGHSAAADYTYIINLSYHIAASLYIPIFVFFAVVRIVQYFPVRDKEKSSHKELKLLKVAVLGRVWPRAAAESVVPQKDFRPVWAPPAAGSGGR